MVHIKRSVVFILAAAAITPVVPLPIVQKDPNLGNPHHGSSPESRLPPLPDSEEALRFLNSHDDSTKEAAHLMLHFSSLARSAPEKVLPSGPAPASVTTSQPQAFPGGNKRKRPADSEPKANDSSGPGDSGKDSDSPPPESGPAGTSQSQVPQASSSSRKGEESVDAAPDSDRPKKKTRKNTAPRSDKGIPRGPRPWVYAPRSDIGKPRKPRNQPGLSQSPPNPGSSPGSSRV